MDVGDPGDRPDFAGGRRLDNGRVALGAAADRLVRACELGGVGAGGRGGSAKRLAQSGKACFGSGGGVRVGHVKPPAQR